MTTDMTRVPREEYQALLAVAHVAAMHRDAPTFWANGGGERLNEKLNELGQIMTEFKPTTI